MSRLIDILMITHRRPAHTRLSLPHLLNSCDETMRVWLWHNGTDEETLGVVRSHVDHPRVHAFRHSVENAKLTTPTNWLLESSTAAYVAKVDDDCLVRNDWAHMLRQAHEDEPRFGVLGCWHFQDDDFDSNLADWKVQRYGEHCILRNCWVGGSGYLMKRECVDVAGPIRQDEGFTTYCIRLAAEGWINGWYYPLITQEHLDDPSSPHTLICSDDDLRRAMPLSSMTFRAANVDAWNRQLRASARHVQQAPIDPSYYNGWRILARRQMARVARLVGVTMHAYGSVA
jgi:hypothetical protein